jgi:hypothetical protein
MVWYGMVASGQQTTMHLINLLKCRAREEEEAPKQTKLHILLLELNIIFL